MALKLNPEVEAHKEFYGRNTEQMPKLIADGRVPMSSAELMQIRVDGRNSDLEVKKYFMDNYFDTGDAVVYHPDGRVKIILDSQYLREMTPETPINNRALILTLEQYDLMDGEEFKKGKLGKTRYDLSKKDVKSHPVWRVLARDPALLDGYADLIFAEVKEKFGYNYAMGIFPIPANVESPEMRAWIVGRLRSRSYADGRGNLDNVSGRLIGVAPEAQEIKSLEGKL